MRLYTWLYRIAINCAKSALVLRRRDATFLVAERRGFDGKQEASSLLRDTDTPADLALAAEVCTAINSAIDALADEQRTVLVMYESKGLTYPQIARAMSCPLGTVRSRVSRARDADDNQVRLILKDKLNRARISEPRSRAHRSTDFLGEAGLSRQTGPLAC